MELLEKESAYTYSTLESIPSVTGTSVNDNGQHAHARLLVHLALPERDMLQRELVPSGLVRPYLVELILEIDRARLVRSLWCERSRVPELLDGEHEQ